MTPQERKVMKLALETLESSRIFVTSREKIKHPEGTDWYDERISAIKEALAQPEQEPMECMCGICKLGHQRTWVGLTDEEIAEVAERMEATDAASSFWREFARAIEAAHGIKENT